MVLTIFFMLLFFSSFSYIFLINVMKSKSMKAIQFLVLFRIKEKSWNLIGCSGGKFKIRR